MNSGEVKLCLNNVKIMLKNRGSYKMTTNMSFDRIFANEKGRDQSNCR